MPYPADKNMNFNILCSPINLRTGHVLADKLTSSYKYQPGDAANLLI